MAEQPPRLAISIPGPSIEEALHQITEARQQADVIELRLDLIDHDSDSIKLIFHATQSLPTIFTLRSREHGGKFSDNRETRHKKLREFAKINPAYIDLEYPTDAILLTEIHAEYPNIKVIYSVHRDDEIKDLEQLFHQMKQVVTCIYKMAVVAHSSIDVLKMLSFIKKMTDQNREVIGISLGEIGQPARILGSIYGNYMTFASLNSSLATGKGQIDTKTLNALYHFKKQKPSTAVYGLIGDPITQSIGHKHHNTLIEENGFDAVYVKFKVSNSEIKQFLDYSRDLNFKGLSVTMPLKETAAVLMDTSGYHDAINTIMIRKNGFSGLNTDGVAVLELIERMLSLRGKNVLILGAGGTAKAVAKELHKAEAKLTFLNRTEKKAEALSKIYRARCFRLDQFHVLAKEGYDLIINCTSVGMDSDHCLIDVHYLLHSKLVVDVISHPNETVLIRAARRCHCPVITGKEIFEVQAHKQFEAWFGPMK